MAKNSQNGTLRNGALRGWTHQNSLELYDVESWGAGFFRINERGNVAVTPGDGSDRQIDLFELVQDLRGRGLRTPLLLRFSDILARRVATLSGAFSQAIREYGYDGGYRGVYPIKVNQQRQVVEELIASGRPYRLGLEAGSKPELLVALALLDTPGALIICNGYKDRAYIETALLAQRLGRTPIIVIDRFDELQTVIRTSQELGIRPHLGVRTRLMAKGAGRWVDSTGNRSKFGLSPTELVNAVECLAQAGLLDCLELVHCHIGSQITAIRAHKEALREVSRVYVGLCELGAKLKMLDVGGGLGVDYDGSSTHFHSSMNYSVQEYANDVVAAIQEACDDAGLDHPDLTTESGRALAAHHSVLVFDVLGVNEVLPRSRPEPLEKDPPRILEELEEIFTSATRKNVLEAYHDALQLREEATSLFSLGYMNLTKRAEVERRFLHCCDKILRITRDLDPLPEDLEDLEKQLADTYFGNLSIFQSAPDHWAVGQLFPVMPIHRLGEKPTRRGVFADLTCDSDGKIDKFIDTRDVKDVLELHSWTGAPYFIGVFLLGAYQEILGDLHNLFGDTDAAHVRIGEDGKALVENIVEGDSIADVLRYVQYDAKTLVERVRNTIEDATRAGRVNREDSARFLDHYEEALREYTYLTRDE